ncbi:MAG: hypothetical protein JRJ87_03295 [Deltaproteobacteria bacterium]|nr:hypothetical protein [Deltaproteobacteria bacterium]
MRFFAVLAVFFLSGVSGLIYQVIWVRVFGNVFGNTIHSAALVTAVFLLGLGAGAYVIGRWSDKKFSKNPLAPLRLYAWSEFLIGALGLMLTFGLPELTGLSAAFSSYEVDASGWHELSWGSHLFRYFLGIVLLAPASFLMGGTLTLLIRFLVARDLSAVGLRIGLLYGVNTLGAAVGCFLTDFSLVPWMGIGNTQLTAVGLNWVAGLGALAVYLHLRRLGHSPAGAIQNQEAIAKAPLSKGARRITRLASIALFLTGFGAMGMEMVWFRHLISEMGAYRQVFSLLLTVILAGICLGASLGGTLQRRLGHSAQMFMVVQCVFVCSTLLLLTIVDGKQDPSWLLTDQGVPAFTEPFSRRLREVLGQLSLILPTIGLPAIMMGFSFPLANALAQRSTTSVGGRAGTLYLWNTFGNVLGSLAAGFVLLPILGYQISTSIFVMCAAFTIIPLQALATQEVKESGPGAKTSKRTLVGCLLFSFAALGAFGLLPGDYLLEKSFVNTYRSPDSRVVRLHESMTGTLMVTVEEGTHWLHTDGHPMSSTNFYGQRYMRAFSHFPLILADSPRRVLVICFGVGTTLHAASLHKSLDQLEVADLSRAILEHAVYFRANNQGVLKDPRVKVYVNDGRHHLLMQPEHSYDLITLEPPPISLAGVSSLYTKEFYELVKSRLGPGGYITQWLPFYQLDGDATLSVVRAFIDVFPDSVLLNGTSRDMILMGRKDGGITFDIDKVESYLADNPAVQRDLDAIKLGTLTELAGSFAASSETLEKATRAVAATTDDRPAMEYSVHSKLRATYLEKGLFDTRAAASWCPTCFSPDRKNGDLAHLSAFLDIMQTIYDSEVFRSPRGNFDDRGRLPFDRGDPAAEAALASSPYLTWLIGTIKRTRATPSRSRE